MHQTVACLYVFCFYETELALKKVSKRKREETQRKSVCRGEAIAVSVYMCVYAMIFLSTHRMAMYAHRR